MKYDIFLKSITFLEAYYNHKLHDGTEVEGKKTVNILNMYYQMLKHMSEHEWEKCCRQLMRNYHKTNLKPFPEVSDFIDALDRREQVFVPEAHRKFAQIEDKEELPTDEERNRFYQDLINQTKKVMHKHLSKYKGI